MIGGDHLGAWQPSGLGQLLCLQTHQVGDEQEQPAAASGEGARGQGKQSDIGHRLNGGAGLPWSFFIQPPRQRSKPFGFEDFPHSGRTQWRVAVLKNLADLINGVVLLAQLDDQVASRGLLGLGLRAVPRREKKGGMSFSAKMVTKDVEGVEGVAEGAGHVFGETALDQISAQGLVLAVFRQAGFQEEAAECTYFFWCANSHENRMSHTTCSVKNNLGHHLQLSLYLPIYKHF
ncbi:MAG: hypothetical protein DMG38_27735 [Acidobacteria bacterium]|nr:MAG: hypothetical protein DMG38_27735 [Acidobacteriota bacterium]